jgi:sulfur carrier protein
MRVTVNGLERDVPDGLTVAGLLEQDQEPIAHVLVEVNGVYLPAARYEEQALREGDQVEIILPAFGG